MSIHQTAIIGKEVIIGKNVSIGPYTIIEGEVTIGDHCQIGPHVHIQGEVILGEHNVISSHATLGCAPQDKKYSEEKTRLIIGDRNKIREFVTISRGTIQDEGLTRIGNDNLLMAYVHIAHDCVVGNHNTFANNASLAGHIKVGDYVGLGGFSAFHQFTQIGSYAFCAGGSVVTKDVPPFTLISGHPAKLSGLNLEGLKRRGFNTALKTSIKQAYRELFRGTNLLHETAQKLLEESDVSEVLELAKFILNSQRGITR